MSMNTFTFSTPAVSAISYISSASAAQDQSMYNDGPLVDLLNARFDDVNQKLVDLKQDLLREVQAIKQKHDEHEEKDLDRFASLDKIKWQVSGAAVTLVGIVKLLERYFDK